jgi:hypothetical protein
MEVTPKRTDAFASLLDLYPTLADLCGLDIPEHLEGRSLTPVLTGKQRSVRDYIVTTLGRSTFCIRQGDAKLIRFYDGSEELYDLKRDPYEFRNRVNDPGQAKTLRKLRALAPEDKRFRRFVRYGRFKATVARDGTMKLYDMLHPKSGIGEQAEVSAENPDVVTLIKKHLEDNKVTERYYTIPNPKG